MGLVSGYPCDVPLTGKIVRQHNVPCLETLDRAIPALDIPFSRKSHNILPARGGMPVNDSSRGSTAKRGFRGRPRISHQDCLITSERQIDFPKMGLLVIASVDPDGLHVSLLIPNEL